MGLRTGAHAPADTPNTHHPTLYTQHLTHRPTSHHFKMSRGVHTCVGAATALAVVGEGSGVGGGGLQAEPFITALRTTASAYQRGQPRAHLRAQGPSPLSDSDGERLLNRPISDI